MTTAAAAGDSTSDKGDGAEVWLAPLDLAALGEHRTSPSLSPEELERAQRLRFESDRERFTAGRIWLRLILGRRLGVGVRDVRLGVRPDGKPELAGPESSWLRFSMSRSGPLGLYALCATGDLGVDIEGVGGRVDTEAFGRRFLTAAERARLAGLGDEEQRKAFYRIWTRKEAALKAIGVGLEAPLQALDVQDDVAAWDLSRPGVPSDRRPWFLYDLEAPPGYAAALATEVPVTGGAPRVRDARQLVTAEPAGGATSTFPTPPP